MTDWAFIVWLFIASLLIWLGVFKCVSSIYINKALIFVLSLIFIVHFTFIALGSSDEALVYLGTPHLFLGAGLYLWWSSRDMEKKQS